MAIRGTGWAACAVGAALLSACGESTPPPSGRSMSASAPAAAASDAATNQAPHIASLSLTPDEPRPGGVVQAVASVSDPDGNPTHLKFSWRVDGEPYAVSGPTFTLPDLPKGADVEVEAIASDGRAESQPVVARATVGNRAPLISDVHFDRAAELRAGDPVIAIVSAEDPDGDPVTLAYKWSVNDRMIEADGDRIETKDLKRGDRVAVRVVANDGDDDSEGFDTPSLIFGNAAPEITSLPTPGMGADGVYRYTVEARDPDRDRSLRFELGAAPTGVQIDPISGELSWSPTFQQAGTHPIEVVVRDGHGGESKQRFEVTVKAVGGSAAQPPAAAEN